MNRPESLPLLVDEMRPFPQADEACIGEIIGRDLLECGPEVPLHEAARQGHVGDGPVLQLIGISAGQRSFVVGISRRAPLPAHDVEQVRESFVGALEGTAGRGGRSGEP